MMGVLKQLQEEMKMPESIFLPNEVAIMQVSVLFLLQSGRRSSTSSNCNILNLKYRPEAAVMQF